MKRLELLSRLGPAAAQDVARRIRKRMTDRELTGNGMSSTGAGQDTPGPPKSLSA